MGSGSCKACQCGQSQDRDSIPVPSIPALSLWPGAQGPGSSWYQPPAGKAFNGSMSQGCLASSFRDWRAPNPLSGVAGEPPGVPGMRKAECFTPAAGGLSRGHSLCLAAGFRGRAHKTAGKPSLRRKTGEAGAVAARGRRQPAAPAAACPVRAGGRLEAGASSRGGPVSSPATTGWNRRPGAGGAQGLPGQAGP